MRYDNEILFYNQEVAGGGGNEQNLSFIFQQRMRLFE